MAVQEGEDGGVHLGVRGMQPRAVRASGAHQGLLVAGPHRAGCRAARDDGGGAARARAHEREVAHPLAVQQRDAGQQVVDAQARERARRGSQTARPMSAIANGKCTAVRLLCSPMRPPR